MWAYLGLPEPTPVQYDIAYYLQNPVQDEGEDLPADGQRKIIEAYRGCGKSYITSAFVLWCFWWNNHLKIMVTSGSAERAKDFTNFCLKTMFNWEPLQHLYPSQGQRKSTISFDINGCIEDHSPSLKSIGINGQITGTRADIIIGDDVETKNNCMTQGMREKLIHLTDEFTDIIKPLPTSQIIYLGTPHHQDSLYNHRSAGGYDLRVYPARVPEKDYGGCLAPMVQQMQLTEEVGTPVDPIRFDEETLTNKEMEKGKTGFILQYMLDTELEDALRFPLRCSDFIVMDTDIAVAPVKVAYGSHADQMIEDLDCMGLKGDRWYKPIYTSKDFEEYQGAVMYVDPSGRGKDKTGYAVVKQLRGYLYVTRCGGLEGGYDKKTLRSLAHIAKNESVNEIIVESNFGDGMFTELFSPILNAVYPCTLTEDKVGSMQKELRIIDTLEPLLNQHRIVLNKQIIIADQATPQKHQLTYQLSRITRDRNSLSHDDTLDALAGAVRYWKNMMAVNVDVTEDKLKEERLMDEVNKYLDSVNRNHRQTNKKNWNNNR